MLFGVVVTLAAAVTVWARPVLGGGMSFLIGDEGVNLFAVSEMQKGRVLFRDTAYPYGPLSIGVYYLAAAFAGNSPLVYLCTLMVLSGVGAALAFALLRRSVSAATTWEVALLGLLPLLTIPGSIVGGFTYSAYLPLQRIVLLLVGLAWTPPAGRPARRAIAIGVWLGAWQLVRFGGAFVAGLAVIVLDLLVLVARRELATHWRRWSTSLLITGAAFAVVQGGWTAIAFTWLPRPVAVDVIWPRFMLETYTWVSGDLRWPGWHGAAAFFTQQWLPLTAGVLGLYGLTGAIKRGGAGVLVPLLFFVVAALGYFRADGHFRMFAWALVPASALVLDGLRRPLRLLVLVAWLPACAPFASAWIQAARGRADAASVAVLPTGHRVVVLAGDDAKLRALARFADATRNGPVLFLPQGSGWHAEFGVPAATRHTWFYSPNVIRPYERDTFIAQARVAAGIVYCPSTAAEPPPLPADVEAALMPFFTLAKAEAGCRLYLPARR